MGPACDDQDDFAEACNRPGLDRRDPLDGNGIGNGDGETEDDAGLGIEGSPPSMGCLLA